MARPKLSSPGQPAWVRIPLRFYELLASLKLAVVLIAALAVVLACATFVDGRFGSHAARFAIYGTPWFAALLGLLAVNVLCAALIRFPWKRYQTGFVITHLGLLVLMAGCLLGRAGGIDAQLSVFEDRAGRLAYVSQQHFRLKVVDRAEPADASAADNPAGQVTTLEIPFTSGPFNWRDYQDRSWFPWQLAHRDRGLLYDDGGIRLEVLDYLNDSRLVAAPDQPEGWKVEPLPFNPKRTMVSATWARRAKIRLTVDGQTKEHWLAEFVPTPVKEPPRGDEKLVLSAPRRRVTAELTRDFVDPGMAFRLLEFDRRLDPGTGQPAHFSSRVDLLDASDPPQAIRRNATIGMNEPIDVVDPATGRSFRVYQESFQGPWKAGDAPFDQLVGPESDCRQLFMSVLTMNYDPGRGLKYTGCLLVVAGLVTMFYMRAYFFKRPVRGDSREG